MKKEPVKKDELVVDPQVRQLFDQLNRPDERIIISGMTDSQTRFSGEIQKIDMKAGVVILTDDDMTKKIRMSSIVSESLQHNFARPRTFVH